ncbi:MAG: mannose-1-phosphate guanylyltransferase/mannose-6-phosphate isomerase [Treponema sp.]|uniref:mannose-1-phosphate guanylyltransferase/mannose-6-phosphate isomerase n=1 Tax=Treponema sp. TaxID=166 RepID=UPI00298E5732|nr:mannose-1-phosphate guanylyltransferase/mannose-6-phosphate isomerase [Treponema sp.]MCQ2600289.1 mannose-1-phosphate guanylyltransferase/mannose-6-phosphate isomerase [Treponema sp.]
MTLIPVILSGGAGTRLWPLSWGDHPKQFLPLVTDNTMIQETLLRLKGLEIASPIVSCGEAHRFLVAEQLNKIGIKPQIILEPMAKNTAPAIAAACCAALKQDKDAVVVVLPSDHVIKNKDVFAKAVMTAAINAEKGSLVTFGIVPTFAATGYGYVKASGAESDGAYTLEKFVEKPCLEKAEEYIASGEYAWNSGMFVFKASTFLEELKVHSPDMARLAIESFEKAEVDKDFIRLDKESFGQIKGDSIDYAVMEKTSKGKIVKLDAGWDDVGSWSALYDISGKDENKNVIKGDVISIGTKSSYIRSSGRTVATIGLENIVVIDSEEGVLVADINKIQDVKKIAEEIKGRNK